MEPIFTAPSPALADSVPSDVEAFAIFNVRMPSGKMLWGRKRAGQYTAKESYRTQARIEKNKDDKASREARVAKYAQIVADGGQLFPEDENG